MGVPTNFKESNFTWKGWPHGAEREEVLDLPAYRFEDRTISCWKLSLIERLYVLFTGRAWLYVWGNHPPVNVSGVYPWKKGDEEVVRDNE